VICGIAGVAVWAYFVAFVAGQETMRWYDWLRIVGMLWTLSFGVLLGWRRPDSAAVRLLSAALVLYAFFDGVLVLGEAAHGARFHGSVAVGFAEAGIVFSCCVLMLRFASMFGRPLTPARQAVLTFGYAAAAGTAIAACMTPFVPAGRWLYAFTDPGHYALPRFAVLLCGILAIAATRDEERQRVGWPFASFGVLYVVSIAGFAGALQQGVFGAAVRLALFVMPLGLTYSALQRRLYDIGFIVNRATVFAAISGILVGSFVLLEWILQQWFGQASREFGLAANVALALLLGISLSFVHRRVDGFVDKVFFKKRHDDVLALKLFAREAALITKRDTLVRTDALGSAGAFRSVERIAAAARWCCCRRLERSCDPGHAYLARAGRTASFQDLHRGRVCLSDARPRRAAGRAGLWGEEKRRGVCARRSRCAKDLGARHGYGSGGLCAE